jgi:hypothetical protein
MENISGRTLLLSGLMDFMHLISFTNGSFPAHYRDCGRIVALLARISQ